MILNATLKGIFMEKQQLEQNLSHLTMDEFSPWKNDGPNLRRPLDFRALDLQPESARYKHL